MLTIILLSCLTITGSSVPVVEEGTTQAQTVQPAQVTNQTPDAQTSIPLSPQMEQPQPGLTLQPGAQAQAGPQFLPPTQFYTWYPLGGSPVFIPLQPSVQGSTLNHPAVPQQPMVFSYFPLISTPYMNPQFGFQMIPQNLAKQPQNSQVLPAENPSGAAALGNAPQPMPIGNAPQPIPIAPQQTQQQQNPQIIYMLQQSMNAPVGSLSSEELEMAANSAQLGVYLTSVLTNPPAGAAQPVNQATGLKNPDQQSIVPTAETPSAGIAATQGLQANTNGVPAGLKGATRAAATVQTPVQAELEPTEGNLV